MKAYLCPRCGLSCIAATKPKRCPVCDHEPPDNTEKAA